MTNNLKKALIALMAALSISAFAACELPFGGFGGDSGWWIILLFLLFRALLPVLYKMKWLPKQMGKAMAKKVEKEEKRTFDPER